METSSLVTQICERVEHLLMRHHELQRTNTLLRSQITQLENERESLTARLNAARLRVNSLLERLPENAPAQGDAL